MPSSRSVGRISSSGSRDQHRVLGLQGRDRVHGVGPADGGRRRLGQPEVAHLALRHQLGHGPDRLLDRRVGVDPVLVVEVDVVDAEPRQRAVAGLAHVLGPAVDGALGRVVGVAHDAELGGDDRLVAAPGQRLADEHLVGVRPVHVGGVEEGDPELEGPVDGGGRLGVVRRPVEVGHPHAAEALAGHRAAPASRARSFPWPCGLLSSWSVAAARASLVAAPRPLAGSGRPPYGADRHAADGGRAGAALDAAGRWRPAPRGAGRTRPCRCRRPT